MKENMTLKKIVTKNCSVTKQTIDYIEILASQLIVKSESGIASTPKEFINTFVQLSEITKQMDACEKIIGSTLQAMLIADLDEVGDEINECFEMYHEVSDRYEANKEIIYNTILNETYLKKAFHQEK